MMGCALSKCAASPPHMTVSCPFAAPASPPEIGASRNPIPAAAHCAPTCFAQPSDAVVWSTSTAPAFIAGIAFPATARTSASCPTHIMTKSAPETADSTLAQAVPLYIASQRFVTASVRFHTETSCPAATKCPAIGYPMTPNPKKATLLMKIPN